MANALPRFTKHPYGFTIVELLIVIVVIAVLAAIVVVAYNGVQTRTKASAIIAGLKSSDKALRLYATDKSLDAWPADNAVIVSVSNPTIQQFIDGTTLKDFMKKAPDVANTPPLSWTYDNDSDVKPACGSRYNGTNIVITGIDQNVTNAIDTSIDDGDNTCGRVRYDASVLKLFYSLSYDSGLSS
jgi:prepilin-type N-terminal cleavage/methylation domain-containing protein